MSNINNTIIDIMLGGGKRHFIPQNETDSNRVDDWNFVENYEKYGWNTFVDSNNSLWNVNLNNSDIDDILPLVGLFSTSHIPYYLDRINMNNNLKLKYDYPGLLDMSKRAIELLNEKYGKNGNNNGFFLMIEGSRIDMCGHSNDIPCMLNEFDEFDDVLKYVYNWAEEDGNTLVVTVADHETGGLALGMFTNYNKLIIDK